LPIRDTADCQSALPLPTHHFGLLYSEEFDPKVEIHLTLLLCR
jgi:hypothetical protein